ncbi:ABC transporter ATP-binding protein [Sporosarcina sp. P16a]|uniref:ABC transporter ATP-binding protein n=1 Tax=unclassified Sporosarcina TaxID=2647733 RepID=UPI000C165643|nr:MULTISPECIES: ABC transporter ATP-binding protein [unclassified Sporosarcina]PIC67540.1 ABC transporter ATP-binding protein [Sporosarcina sp. P16a]PIC92991.1 ABC transporter ATP-binding protein [Sporosarcina sp. P25]
MNVIEMNQVTKVFGTHQALDGLDLTVKNGEVFGFIGPNGAGKSTAIRVLLGMLHATNGTATIFGKDVWQDAVDIHRRVAYVPGDVNLWPQLTGGEVIDLFASLQGKINEQKREQLLVRFQLDPTKKCRTYSKGNRQKVALVAAFASDAELFLLDEPTSGLDPLMEKVFQQCVAEVKAEGKTVLLSSHILSEVEKLCDRVGIIRQGRLIECGTLNELRHLTRMQLTVETRKPIESLVSWQGVHDVAQTETGWTFHADAGEMEAVMQKLSAHGLRKIESAPPTLEDLFMRHYEETAESKEL